ncbi:MAG: hypothetical protein QOG63_1447 [Thermoleophilaceae bacterium]|jgi:hypothetical protein|nr:hypothetical protein [Thermoleophilaceae bacterium]
MRRTPSAAIVAAAALALAGCGGADAPSDEAAIKTVVHDYFIAFADGDGTKACDQLGADTRTKIEQGARGKDCATALEDAAKRPQIKPYLTGFRKVEILKVTVAGRDASAKVKAIGAITTMPLRKEIDGWKIEGTKGAPGS